MKLKHLTKKTRPSDRTILPKGERIKSDKSLPQNFVAKHARTFNKSSIEDDKKKKIKKGYQKHKTNYKSDV